MTNGTKANLKELVKYIAGALAGAIFTLLTFVFSTSSQVSHNAEEVARVQGQVVKIETLVNEMVKFNAAQVELNNTIRDHIKNDPIYRDGGK